MTTEESRIERVIAEMQAALASDHTDLNVEDFPDDPAAYEFYHDTGCLLVRYDGADFGEDAVLGGGAQDQDGEYVVTLLMRDLMGKAGVYRRLEGVRRSITGKRFDGMRPARALSEGLVKRMGSAWRFDLRFRIDGTWVAAPAPDDFPALQSTDIQPEA